MKDRVVKTNKCIHVYLKDIHSIVLLVTENTYRQRADLLQIQSFP